MQEHKNPFSLITKYVIEGYHIDINKDYVMETIPARQLIVPERIDLMAKWIYIDSYVRGMDRTDAIALYTAHLDAFSLGSFMEPGEEYKNSIESYLTIFNTMIEDIRENGFDADRSIIPVGRNNVILDGSHRVSIAAYFDQMVTVIRFPECSQDFGAMFFSNNLLHSHYLKLMMNQYIMLAQNCFFACIWPIAYDEEKMDAAEKIIQEYGKIVYIQDIRLNYNGMKNFMAQIYGHQSWVGTFENHFAGVDSKVQPCFKMNTPIRTIVFESESLEKVLEVKERIREIYGLENHSIHISDNVFETRQMSNLLYNENSLHHLNYGQTDAFMSIHKRMNEFKELVKKNNLELNRFIVDSGSVLEVYGLRQSRDMDYLTDYIKTNLPQTEEVDNHISELPYYGCSIEDLLYNPKNYFVYNGVKFVTLQTLLTLKRRRNEKKDQRDAKMILKSIRRKKKSIYSEEKILAYERKHKMYGQGLMSKKAFVKCRIYGVLHH